MTKYEENVQKGEVYLRGDNSIITITTEKYCHLFYNNQFQLHNIALFRFELFFLKILTKVCMTPRVECRNTLKTTQLRVTAA